MLCSRWDIYASQIFVFQLVIAKQKIAKHIYPSIQSGSAKRLHCRSYRRLKSVRRHTSVRFSPRLSVRLLNALRLDYMHGLKSALVGSQRKGPLDDLSIPELTSWG